MILPALKASVTVLCLAVASPAAGPGEQPSGRLCFVDEGGREPSLVEFRDRLQKVLRNRDVEALRPMVAGDVFLNADASGFDTFVELHEFGGLEGGEDPAGSRS